MSRKKWWWSRDVVQFCYYPLLYPDSTWRLFASNVNWNERLARLITHVHGPMLLVHIMALMTHSLTRKTFLRCCCSFCFAVETSRRKLIYLIESYSNHADLHKTIHCMCCEFKLIYAWDFFTVYFLHCVYCTKFLNLRD